nr:DinB family protein [Paenibacillus tyrfis]
MLVLFGKWCQVDCNFFTRTSSERYRAFFRQQADLEKAIVLDNPYAGIRETRLSEIVMQVVNHGTYHRGNISAMLRQMGYASVMTEYALFWYQDQA